MGHMFVSTLSNAEANRRRYTYIHIRHKDYWNIALNLRVQKSVGLDILINDGNLKKILSLNILNALF